MQYYTVYFIPSNLATRAFPAFGTWAEKVEEERAAAVVGVALTLALGVEGKYDVVFLVAERWEKNKGGGNCDHGMGI